MPSRRSATSGAPSGSRDALQTTTVATLKPDPANVRRHTPRNVGMIETALREVGAARSIVIDENDTVLAGNATIAAAAAAGIERVQVVEADGETLVAVRRRGLTPEQKARLALYDNRAAELAECCQAETIIVPKLGPAEPYHRPQTAYWGPIVTWIEGNR